MQTFYFPGGANIILKAFLSLADSKFAQIGPKKDSQANETANFTKGTERAANAKDRLRSELWLIELFVFKNKETKIIANNASDNFFILIPPN